MTTSAFKEDSHWMAEALTKLVNFSVKKLKRIEYPKFADAVAEFLYDDFFQYETVQIYAFADESSVWKRLSQRGSEETSLAGQVSQIPLYEEDKIWAEGKYLYHFFKMDEEYNLLVVSLKDETATYSEYEYSFLSMLVTLADSFYHMKKLGEETQRKAIELTNLRASSRIINGLKENSLSLEDAIIELDALLSLDGVILAVPAEGSEYKIVLTRGSSITTWDEFVSFLLNTEAQSEFLEVFSLVDARQHMYGIVACRLSQHSPALYAIQMRVLEQIISQITLVLSEHRMSKEAVTDALTGLYNRRYVEDVLRKRENKVKRDSLYKLSVLMMDVDHFKRVNDTYGHKAGDKVLKTISGVIKRAVRDVDVVGRYGGEEIIVLMQSEFEIAKKVAERIRGNIEQTTINIGSQNINITLSIGAAPFTPATSSEQVVQWADENLYKAKKNGRNQVVY